MFSWHHYQARLPVLYTVHVLKTLLTILQGKTKGKNKKKVALTGGKAGKKDDMDYNDYGNEFDDFM